jgi:hypothetical protein
MKKYLVVLTILITTLLTAQTAPVISTRNVAWGSVNVNYRLNQVWTSVNDFQYRQELSDGDLIQLSIRTGISYRTRKQILFTGGVAFFLLYPNPNGAVPRQEFRIWEEAGRKFNFRKRHIVYPRLRFEQRFIREYLGSVLEDAFTFNTFRLRLRADYTYEFGIELRWSIFTGDEYMIHRRGDGFTTFDQNRLWAGAGYKVNDVLQIQLNYLHIYQRRTSALHDQFHVIRLTLQFNFASDSTKPVLK